MDESEDAIIATILGDGQECPSGARKETTIQQQRGDAHHLDCRGDERGGEGNYREKETLPTY